MNGADSFYDEEQDLKDRIREYHDPSIRNGDHVGKHLSDEAIEKRRHTVHRAIYTVDLGTITGAANAAGTVLFPGGLHLQDGLEIGGVSIEHNGTTAPISVYEGAGGAGRIVAIVKPGFLRTVTLPDFISNVSLRIFAADSGLVIVTIATHVFAPGVSKLS